MQKSNEILAQVRNLMKENNIDVYIVPDTDPHMNEYVPDHWRIISWLTGFTGSSATVVITAAGAGLWTDSRYELQAREQLAGSGYELMQPVSTDKNSYLSWIDLNVPAGSVIGFDGRLLASARYKKLKDAADSRGFSINHESDFITPLWTQRPALPATKAFEHSLEFAGADRFEKITAVRNEMSKAGVNYHLLTAPDDIMWLLNIRGGDIRYSPVLLSYAIIGEEQILLFADEMKIPFRTAKEFDEIGVIMLPYEEASGMLSSLDAGTSVLVSPATTSCDLVMSIPEGVRIVEDLSIPSKLKAIKNSVEAVSLGKAMIRDGIALTRFFHWVELNTGTVPMSEMSLTEKLNHFRSEQENFLSLSFSSIVAWNEHSALPHYNAIPGCDSVIGQDGLLLIDSGSQYPEGTTDITRTVPIGRPSEKQ
ncbi:MAG TPA: aminopeptidase P family N-terminal domain-containing protein, partial [Bacteroidales bacterium]|nr:aminopeptidase P family N-terminal domain-containing protein [Bacteroidales bacterium]